MKVLKINNNIITLNNNALASDFGDKIVYDITPQNAKNFIETAQAQYPINGGASIVENYKETGSFPVGNQTTLSGNIQLSYFDGNNVDKSNVNNYMLDNISPNGGRISVIDNSEDTLKSSYIKPTGSVRFIETRPFNYNNNTYYSYTATYNARDIGGWTCDGGIVKYGKIYRCGAIHATGDFPNQAKQVWLNELGIKQELDLRSDGTYNSNFPVAYYKKYDGAVQYISVVGTGSYDTVLIQELKDVFQAIKGLPTLIHCSMGCDRTGTLCFYIEAILGMSETDIDIDYELSSLTIDTSESTSQYLRQRTDTNWFNLKAKFNNYAGTTLSDRVINYLLSIGITADELNEFRSVMCDGTPSIIIQPVINVFNKDDPDVVIRGRFNSSHQVVNYVDGELVTGFISCKLGDTIKLETDRTNIKPLQGTNVYTGAIQFYDSNKTFILLRTHQSVATPVWQWSDDGKTGILNIESDAQHVIDNAAYFRICCAYTDIDNIIITKE